jgi:hypothetical protein
MKKPVLLALALVTLSGCGAVDTLKDGFAHSQAVSASLEKSLGAKSFVGFNWFNGTLNSVNITFQEVPNNKTLQEILSESKSAVAQEFKQNPQQIVVSFSVKP